jgi:hypothetical protein
LIYQVIIRLTIAISIHRRLIRKQQGLLFLD